MTSRDARIARLMRLFTNLADRDAFMSRDYGRRLEGVSAAQAFGLAEVDAKAILMSDETDRVCGAALRKLRSRVDMGVVDVLGWLDQERVAALLLTLPTDRRRRITERDPVWNRAWHAIDRQSIWELQLYALGWERGGPEMSEGVREGIRERAEQLAA